MVGVVTLITTTWYVLTPSTALTDCLKAATTAGVLNAAGVICGPRSCAVTRKKLYVRAPGFALSVVKLNSAGVSGDGDGVWVGVGVGVGVGLDDTVRVLLGV